MQVNDEQLSEFFRPVDVDVRVPIVDRSALENGVLLRYDGSKEILTRSGKNTLHTFTTQMGDGVAFQLWGTGGLNQQLGKVRKGSLIFVSYRGLLPSEDNSGVNVHRWVVNEATVKRHLIPLDFLTALKPHTKDLEAAIERAAKEEAEAFARRVEQGHTGGMQSEEEYFRSLVG